MCPHDFLVSFNLKMMPFFNCLKTIKIADQVLTSEKSHDKYVNM